MRPRAVAPEALLPASGPVTGTAFNQRRVPAVLRLLLLSLKAWKQDNVPRLGAALAYYSLFAMAPVLLVVISVAGLVWGQEAVRSQIVGEIDHLIGREGATVIQDMLRAAARPREGRLGTIIGGATFLVAVTGAFVELQAVLNRIWRVKPKQRVRERRWLLRRLLLNRLRSFGLVLTISFLILISLAASAALTALSSWVSRRYDALSPLWPVASEVVSLAVMTLLFAMIYKLLPDVKLQWRHVWLGAGVTALLFTAGKFLIAFYIARTNTGAAYGAAAAVAVILIWVYFTTQIVLLGAEFTRLYAQGHHIVPPREPYARTRAAKPA